MQPRATESKHAFCQNGHATMISCSMISYSHICSTPMYIPTYLHAYMYDSHAHPAPATRPNHRFTSNDTFTCTCLHQVAAQLALKRTEVANARDALEAKKERLEMARRKLSDTKKRLENEFLAANDLEKSAQQIDELNREQEKALRATEKELAQLKQVCQRLAALFLCEMR
jgi:hypothetical protein